MREPYDSSAQYGKREQDESVLGLSDLASLPAFIYLLFFLFVLVVYSANPLEPQVFGFYKLSVFFQVVSFFSIFFVPTLLIYFALDLTKSVAHTCIGTAISTTRTRRSDHSQRSRFAASSSAERICPLCLLFSPRVEPFGDRTTATHPACPARCPSESRYASASPDAATTTATGRACCYSETARVTIRATEPSSRIQTRQPASIRSF